MDSRERILAVVNHDTPDRVPTDIWATPEVWEKLRSRFGTDADALTALHVDAIPSVEPTYIGPALPTMGEGETVDYWGIRRKRISYGAGEYDEISWNPLSEARNMEDLDRYQWPKADWFDYSHMRETARSLGAKQAVMAGYMALFFQHNKLRGLKASLLDPLTKPEFTHCLLQRISGFLFDYHLHVFQACEGLIDITQVTDDFGTQIGPMISLRTFREFYMPHMQRFIELAHRFGIKVFHHDDGSIRAFLPDLVEMGIDILNPVQWRCPGMELGGLKRDFGDKLCFHGGIDNQHTLPFATTEDVRREVRQCIDLLSSDRTGYILAPCHNIQAITPIENILAMYDEAWAYGGF